MFALGEMIQFEQYFSNGLKLQLDEDFQLPGLFSCAGEKVLEAILRGASRHLSSGTRDGRASF